MLRRYPGNDCPGADVKPYVVERFDDSILDAVARHYGTTSSDLVNLGGFESFVYEFEYDNTPAILKVSHSDRRTVDLLASEAEFTRYLDSHGIPVASVMLSTSGDLTESVPDGHGSEFIGMAWTKADGENPPRHFLDRDYWYAHGNVLARMHVASRTFEPTLPEFTRPHWDDPLHLEDSLYIPESDAKANAEMRRLLKMRQSLPRSPDAYGLVHMDAHGGNTHWDGDTATVFDFDDCGYTWFADDIAIVMYYALLAFDDPVEAAHTIWPIYVEGYQDAAPLDPNWCVYFPEFLSWRDHLLYSIIFRSLADDDEFDADAWIGRFHQRHSGDTPIIDYDFAAALRV